MMEALGYDIELHYVKRKKMKIKTLFGDGAVGYYSYCEVTQIILNDKQSGEYWNYFTHIHFSNSFQEETLMVDR